MADKFVDKTGGEEVLKTPIQNSAGAGDSGKLVALDDNGLLDSSFLPPGTVDTISAPASENLAARDYVNVWNDAGTTKVRKADATDDTKPADGIVIASVTSGASATVYKRGRITGFTGLTADSKYYLSETAGIGATTPPSASGNVMQPLGFSEGTTVMNVDINRNDVTEIA
jgi:hypothetical protein